MIRVGIKLSSRLTKDSIYLDKTAFVLVKKPSKSEEKEEEPKGENVQRDSLVDVDYNSKKLFKKGVNLIQMKNLKRPLQFLKTLRIDPDNVETLLKLDMQDSI